MFLQILLIFVIQNGILSEQVNKWSSLKQSSDFLKIINKVLNTEKYDKFFYVDIDSKNIPLDRNYETNNEKTEEKLIKSENANAHVYSANGVRLHLIKNPEVLFQYQKKIEDRLRNVRYDPSSGKSKAAYIQDILADLRRNAVFRLDKTSGEANNLNEDRSLEVPPNLQSQRKLNMNSNDNNVAPLIFITEEPHKSKRNKKIDKRSDLPKWDDKHTKSKHDKKDKKHSKDDDFSSKKYNKEFTYKKNSDNHNYKRKNDDYEFENDDYKVKNDDYKLKNNDYTVKKDNYKVKNEEIKLDNYDYKHDNDDYKYKNDDYKYKNDDFKPKNNKYTPHDDYNPRDDYKPYKNNDYDSYKPKINYHDNYESNNKPYKPKVDSYKYKDDKPKQIKRKGDEAALFGRTPIPYMGKRGIYED